MPIRRTTWCALCQSDFVFTVPKCWVKMTMQLLAFVLMVIKFDLNRKKKERGVKVT